MCCFSKEELEKIKAIAGEKKKIREALKNIKPSAFEEKEEGKEVFVRK